MLTDPLQTTLQGAKDALSGGSKMTQTSIGNPLASFEPNEPKLNIPQSHQYQGAPYSMARKMRATQ